MRLLLAMMFLASILVAWFSYYVVRGQREAKLVEELGKLSSELRVSFSYDYEFNEAMGGLYDRVPTTPGPAILKQYFGENLFCTVENVTVAKVNFEETTFGETNLENELEAFKKIVQFSNLRQLNLFYTQLEDLSSISKIPKLERLNLVLCGSNDLSPLRDAESLKQLNLTNCLAIKDLTPLLDVPNLDRLALSQMACDDSVLKGLPNLKELSISKLGFNNNNIESIGDNASPSLNNDPCLNCPSVLTRKTQRVPMME